MRIIELSSWDKDKINEEELSQYDGVFLRLGYRGIKSGKITMDTCFRNYLKLLKDNNIPIGIYFVTSAVNILEAREEARYCLEVINTFDIKLSFPIIVLNDSCNTDNTGRSDNIPKNKRTDCILSFVNTIEDAGYKACLYCREEWFTKNLLSAKLMFKYKWFIGKPNSIRNNYNLGYQDSINNGIKESIWYGEISEEFAKI